VRHHDCWQCQIQGSLYICIKGNAQQIKNTENCVFRYFKGILLVLENESITRVISESLSASGDEGGLMVFWWMLCSALLEVNGESEQASLLEQSQLSFSRSPLLGIFLGVFMAVVTLVYTMTMKMMSRSHSASGVKSTWGLCILWEVVHECWCEGHRSPWIWSLAALWGFFW